MRRSAPRASAGALTVGLANNREAPLLGAVDVPVFLDSGAEVIVGSTRMGAGTAQKAALGLLSSLAMIRLGHVYDGLMVNLRVDNAKLRKRAVTTLAAHHRLPTRRSGERRSIAPAASVKPAALVAARARAGGGRADAGRDTAEICAPRSPGLH